MTQPTQSEQRLVEQLAEAQRRIAELEKAVRKTDAEAALLQTIPLGVHECDASGRITFANPAVEEFIGYTAQELLGSQIWDHMAPGPDRDALPEYLSRLVAEQPPPPPTPFAAQAVTKSGELRDVRIDWSYQRDLLGNVVGFVFVVSDVTDRNRAEERLRGSERTLRTLMNASPESIVLMDVDGTIRVANETVARRLGKTVDEITGRIVYDFFPPELAAQRRRHVAEVVRTGTPVRFEDQRLDLFVENMVCPILDEDGGVAGIAVLSIDRTERKQTEDALRTARDELERRVEERTAALIKANEELAVFGKFLEASNQGFSIAKLDGEITYVNPPMSRLLSVGKPEDMIGRHISHYGPKGYPKTRETEIVPKVLQEGHWQGEMLVPRGHGIVSFQQNSFLVRDDRGNPAYLATVMTDITERKAAEEALRQSEERYRGLLEACPDAVIMADFQGKALFASRQTWRLLGLDESVPLVGRSVHEFVIEADRRRSMERLPLLAESGVLKTLEYTAVRQDGTTVPTEISAAVSRDAQGRPVAFLAIVRDITERKRTEQKLREEHRTLRHLLQSSDHERQLIAYEIHDGLAQHLAGAIMQFQTFSHQKERNLELAAKAFDAGMTMLQQGHFEARRLIAGVRPPILDESGVLAAIGHLVNEQNRLRGPNIDFRSSVLFDRLVPTVENAIYRIVQEGLANACQHSKSEKVRVGLVQSNDVVQIDIRDWGVGFDPKSLGEGCYGIAGIRQRARLLGGKCSIRSKVGKGAHIVVELPVVKRD